MKKASLLCVFFLLLLAVAPELNGQCSICTRTAQQLGEKPARGMNSGIIYLALTPFIIVGYIGYRWWRSQRAAD
ncbi:MAG TPA: hypothetical protein VEB63_05110 [Chitinophagaceae bacterium]|nr:hypothetical protein [Chitinophagaceae bacterium]